MGVFDVDLIMSWTPKEYLLFLKGVRHKQVDDYEFMAKTAMAHRYAQNSKKARESSIFNAKRAHKMIERGFRGNVADIEKERLDRMSNALKGFVPEFKRKEVNP